MTIPHPCGMPIQRDYDSATSWIAAVWSVLLEQDIVPDENFFEAGGDSLLALEAAGIVREAGYPDLPISAVLRWPTAAEFSSHLR